MWCLRCQVGSRAPHEVVTAVRAAAYRVIRSSMMPSAAIAMPAARPLPNSWSCEKPETTM